MNVQKFDDFGIDEDILCSLGSLGYIEPTDVQKEVIPLALKGLDLIVKSKTGSGKTAAFGIPICDKIKLDEKRPQALILTPTRELAVQIREDISNIGRFKKIRCAAVYGKQPMEIQTRELKQRVHIIAGTPGRTFDHIERGNIDLSEIGYLVIDEADKMLSMGFIEQVETIIRLVPEKRTTMLFSATIPEEIERLCSRYMKKPEIIEISPGETVEDKILQFCYRVDERSKFGLLTDVIYTQRPESCIIFCNTKDAVDNLWQRLKDRGFSCSRLHGGMEQKDRLDVISRFKGGEFVFLIATDVAARGIHVEDVSHVINYDVPEELEGYVHRVGRTGRAGMSGTAITFVTPSEERLLGEIEGYICCSLEFREAPLKGDVENGKKLFQEMGNAGIKLKQDKKVGFDREITKVYIGAGKKKKVSAGNIVGVIANLEGVSADDIGIIDVQDNFSYVDILNGKGSLVIESLQNGTIKGKKVRVERAEK